MRLRHQPYISKRRLTVGYGVLLIVCLLACTTIAVFWWRYSLYTWNTNHYIFDLAFSPDGNLIVAAESSKERLDQLPGEASRSTQETRSIHVRRFADGEVVSTLDGLADDVWAVTFSPNGMWIAASSADDTTKVWDVSRREILVTLPSKSSPFAKNISFSHDNQILAIGSEEQITLWKTADWKKVTEFTPGARSIAFSPDGTFLAGIRRYSSESEVKIWQVQSGNAFMNIATPDANSISWSPDGTRLAIADNNSKKGPSINIWQMNNKNQEISLPVEVQLTTLTWSPNAQTLAAGGLDLVGSFALGRSSEGSVMIWRTMDWQLLKTFRAHRGGIPALVFSPDNSWLVSGSEDKRIRFWPEVNSTDR